MEKGQGQRKRRRLRKLLIGLGLCVALIGGAWLALNHYANSPSRRVAVVLDQLRPPRQPTVFEKVLRWMKIGPTAPQPSRLDRMEDTFHALVEMGPDAVETLIATLQDDPNADVRTCAVCALGRIGDKRAVEPLIDVMRDKEIRGVAVRWLSEFDDPRVLPAMETALYDGDDEFADSAANFLALRAVGDGKAALAVLARAVTRGRRSETMVALLAMGTIHSDDGLAFDALASVISDPNEHVAKLGAEYVGRTGHPNVASILIKALAEGRPLVAAEAAKGLSWCHSDARVVPALIKALSHKGAMVRAGAATSLGEIADPRVTQPLIGALKDQSLEVRTAAAEGLGWIGDPAAVDGLLAMLADSRQPPEPAQLPADDRVMMIRGFDLEIAVEAALRSLGYIGDSRATAPLLRLLADDPDHRWAFYAWKTLGWIGDKSATPALIRALKGGTGQYAAVLAAGWLRDPATANAVLPLLKDRSSSSISSEAAFALAMLGQPEGIDALAANIRDSGYLGLRATIGLAYLDTPEARRVLRQGHNVLAKRCLQVPVSQALAEMLADSNRESLESPMDLVLEVLGQFNDPAALEALDKYAAESRSQTHLLAAVVARRIRRLNLPTTNPAGATRDEGVYK